MGNLEIKETLGTRQRKKTKTFVKNINKRKQSKNTTHATKK
jgi:hypothetical protein